MPDRTFESRLLAVLRDIAGHPAARGLKDDAAVLPWPLGLDLVATHDMLVEGVHFLADCPPADIGWKLVAVNVSDLAGMGARPVAMLLGAGFGPERDAGWAGDLVRGVGRAAEKFGIALIGGDTVRTREETVLSLTALGSVPDDGALGREGARAGDDLWVSGAIGDSGLGLRSLGGGQPSEPEATAALVRRYRLPQPRVELGLALRGIASACMDVSDGLLIDAQRLAQASNLMAELRLGAMPVSASAHALLGEGLSMEERITLATFGDDYELLFTAPRGKRDAVRVAAAAARTPVTRIGTLTEQADGSQDALRLVDAELPSRLGFLHD